MSGDWSDRSLPVKALDMLFDQYGCCWWWSRCNCSSDVSCVMSSKLWAMMNGCISCNVITKDSGHKHGQVAIYFIHQYWASYPAFGSAHPLAAISWLPLLCFCLWPGAVAVMIYCCQLTTHLECLPPRKIKKIEKFSLAKVIIFNAVDTTNATVVDGNFNGTKHGAP